VLRWIVCLTMVVTLCGCTGCRTVAAKDPVDRILVTVSPAGMLSVGDDSAAPERVKKLLRTHGGHPETTEVLLSIPEKATPEDLAPTVGALRAAGYSRIVLVRPRKASATISARQSSRP
jgi:biopolymer transport protein ExbD